MWNRHFNLPSMLMGISLGILLEYFLHLVDRRIPERELPKIHALPKTYRSDGYQRIGHSDLVFIPGEDTLQIVESSNHLLHLRILSKKELHEELERLKTEGLIDMEPVF